MLDRVTITGADDSINPESLIDLTHDFPYVEWGILISAKHFGTPRFPSLKWLEKVVTLPRRVPLSAHLCGIIVRELLDGRVAWTVPDQYERIQLNFHRDVVDIGNAEAFSIALKRLADGREVIFQLDGARGQDYLLAFHEHGGRGVPLVDASGGAGIVPVEWPDAEYFDLDCEDERWAYHGYAGGLGPDNLAAEIPRILKAAAGTDFTQEGRIWIDLETKARSDNDRQFDMEKVRRCLEIAKPFVVKE